MPTYRLVVEYDGSAFHGLQWQPTLRTVAGVLEASLSSLFHEPVKITAAGRTDTGVHATGQVVTFHAERDFPRERLVLAVNGTTPGDVSVLAADVVADGASARFDALERIYDYVIVNRRSGSALWRGRAWHVPRPIDDARFVHASLPLLGEHDFIAFCGEHPQRGGTVRDIAAIELRRREDMLRVTVRGKSFLHHMVRTIVGTLVDAATGYRDLEIAQRALAARDRRAAGTTAPAHGLYFAGVRYPDLDTYRPIDFSP